jgi:hypothetical protein
MRSVTRLIIVLSSINCSGIDGIWVLSWVERLSAPADDLRVCLSRADLLTGRSLRDMTGLSLADTPAGRPFLDDAGLSWDDEERGCCCLCVEDVENCSAVPSKGGGRCEAMYLSIRGIGGASLAGIVRCGSA